MKWAIRRESLINYILSANSGRNVTDSIQYCINIADIGFNLLDKPSET